MQQPGRHSGHLASADVVAEMYQQTIPLFREHKALFSTVRLVNVTGTGMLEPRQHNVPLPDWIRQNDLQHYLPN